MKYFLIIFFFLSFLRCNKKNEILSNDIYQLKKYIHLPIMPDKVQYEVSEIELRNGSQDCKKQLGIVGVLKYSKQNFRELEDYITKENSYDIELSKNDDFYRDWFPDDIKQKFSRNDNSSVYDPNIATKIYKGDFLISQYHEGNATFFITENNEMIIKIGICN